MIPAPKKENQYVGFKYSISLEQMKEHQGKSAEEIFTWIEEYARFLDAFQTPEDKERMRMMKNKKTSW